MPQQYLWSQVEECHANTEFIHSVLGIYESLDEETPLLDLTCSSCGDCCRFDTSGIRLYLSTGELAALSSLDPPVPEAPVSGRCPYQVGNECHARNNRPLGCRIFFCENPPGYNMEQEYERWHGAIQSLHQTHCLPYAYVDIVDAFLQLHSRK